MSALKWETLSDSVFVAVNGNKTWVITKDPMAGRDSKYSLITTYSYGREAVVSGRELDLDHCKEIARKQDDVSGWRPPSDPNK